MLKKHKQQKRGKKSSTGKGLVKADRGVVTQVPRGLAFSTVTRATLKYDMYFDASITADVFTYYEFAANGLYDPDLTGTGHQPYMFDQYSDRYTKYRVLSFRYQVEVPAGTSENSFKVGTQVRNDNYTPTFPAFFEQPYTKSKASSLYSSPIVLKGIANLTKISARPANYMNDDRYSSVVTSNPAELISFYVGFLASASSTLRTFVTLYYEVEFYDPHPVSTSSGTKGVCLNRMNSSKVLKKI